MLFAQQHHEPPAAQRVPLHPPGQSWHHPSPEAVAALSTYDSLKSRKNVKSTQKTAKKSSLNQQPGKTMMMIPASPAWSKLQQKRPGQSCVNLGPQEGQGPSSSQDLTTAAAPPKGVKRSIISPTRSPKRKPCKSLNRSRSPSWNRSSSPAAAKSSKLSKFYVLQQPEPLTFIVAQDNPDNKFTVQITSQTCTCCNNNPCPHLTFLQSHLHLSPFPPSWMEETDAENEAIQCGICSHTSDHGQNPFTQSCGQCQAPFHKSCFGILVEHHDRHQSNHEGIPSCPLCRGLIIRDVVTPGLNKSGSASSSGLPSAPRLHLWNDPLVLDRVVLPSCASIPQEHWTLASSWIPVLGRDLVACFFSRDWMHRELALQRLAYELTCIFKSFQHPSYKLHDYSAERVVRVWKCAIEILVKAVDDKVYKVYLAAIKSLHTLMAFTRDAEATDSARVWLKPIMQTVFLKAADANRRTSQLSLAVMLEFAKGSKGELRLASAGSDQGDEGLDALLQMLLSEEREPFGKPWQYALGRLVVLDALLRNFPSAFKAQAASPFGKPFQQSERIRNVLDFCFRHIQSSHSNVAKMARKVFTAAVRFVPSDSMTHGIVAQLISTLDPTLQRCMSRKLHLGLSPSSSPSSKWSAAVASTDTHPEEANGTSMMMSINESATAYDYDHNDLSSRRKVSRISKSTRTPSNCSSSKLSRRNSLKDLRESTTAVLQGYPDALTLPLPYIPWLMGPVPDPSPSQHTDKDDAENSYYREGIHWSRSKFLGKGTFSSCYQARDVLTGTLMAVKQIKVRRLNPEENERMQHLVLDEIHLMESMDHPHIVRMYGAVQEGDQVNIFIEWMAGGSVAHLLDKHGPFSEPVIIGYTYQILQGLRYLHSMGILHRDLKGANLLVDMTGHHLRIGDFGAAARLSSSAEDTVHGEFQGQLQGTIAFMSPEILRGETYGRSCDIWSLGCCLIEMSTGKPPWNASDFSNNLALIFKIAGSERPPPLPDHLSGLLLDLIRSCLEIQADLRPSAEKLLLHDIFGHESLLPED